MGEWLKLAKKLRDEKFPTCPWVFYTDEGERLYWFCKAWESACTRAGLPNLLFHDLRRSAVRNMERAGIPRKVAMSISGHKTENVYRRYDIIVERDLSDATKRMDQYFEAMKAQAAKQSETTNPDAASTLSDTPADSPAAGVETPAPNLERNSLS
jgi:integrase